MIVVKSMGRRKRLFFAISAVLIIVLTSFLIKSARASESFSYSTNVNYFVNSEGAAAVKETYNITNKTSSQYLDSIKISTPGVNINNVEVYYINGGKIPFETTKLTQQSGGYNYEYTEIKVNFNRANAGEGLQWGFVIQYNTTDVVENKGRANVVYIPGISPENRDQYSVDLTVPANFGNVHGFGKLPKLVSQSDTTKTYSFSKEELLSNSVQLLFGDSTTYKANFVFPLNNTSNFPEDFEVALPPSTQSQTSYIENLQPAPISTRIDGDGNVIAKYRLEPNQKLKVQADVLADVQYIQYDLSNSGTIENIPQEIKNKYTKSTKYWPADNVSIKKKAQELTAGKKDVAEKVASINEYVIKTLNYNNDKIKYNIRQGALEALNNPNNVVCLEYADLTIALLRAASIPARMPVGYAYSGDLKQSPSVSDSLHAWVQAYIPNNGWINLDPTWGEKFNNFGISDIDHMDFAIWGESDSEPVAIAANQKDTNYQYEDVRISYTSTQPELAKDSRVSATNWVVLPFFSITSYEVVGPSNATIFNSKVELSGGRQNKQNKIGPVAPAQSIKANLVNLGLSFVAYSRISFVDGVNNRELASANISENYMPLVLIVVVLSVIIVVLVIKLRNNKVKSKVNNQYEQEKE